MSYNHEPDRVDWLDLGPDPDEGVEPRDPRRRYLWYGAAAALVALALALTQTQHGTNRAAQSTRSPARVLSSSPASSGSFVNPTPPVTATSDGLSTGLTAVPQVAPLKVTSLGHRLLDVPADWELFGQGPGVVVRIQLALGRITTTAVPVAAAEGEPPASFVVGSDRAFVRPQSDSMGYVVRDGKRATELPPSLQAGYVMYPGPDQRHLWTSDGAGLTLVNLDGKPTGVTIDVPLGSDVQASDGAGYVLLSATGGVYDARPGRVHRITTGMLLASGPTGWLTWECDDSLVCGNIVVDQATGARHLVGTPTESAEQNSSTLSPDGKTAALLQPSNGINTRSIQLLDLESGLARSVEVTLGVSEFPLGSLCVWSPDSRWLFVADARGQVIIVNRATGKTTPLGAQLVPVTQLALRHSTG